MRRAPPRQESLCVVLLREQQLCGLQESWLAAASLERVEHSSSTASQPLLVLLVLGGSPAHGPSFLTAPACSAFL